MLEGGILVGAYSTTVYLLCVWPLNYAAYEDYHTGSEKDVGMELCQYVDLCFHALSLPWLYTFCHAVSTSFYIFFNVFKVF